MWIELLALLFLIYLFGGFDLIERAATSPGTLLQLVAKGPQDVYLTGYPNWWRPPFADYSFERLSHSKNDLYYRKYAPYNGSSGSFLSEFPFFW